MGAAAVRLLRDEAVRQFVLQDVAQFAGDGREALNRDADAAVIERAGPTGRASDIGEGLIGVENHGDRLGRREIELRLKIAVMLFERAENPASQIGSSGAGIFH